MFCEKCGASNDDTAKVCGSCGAELAATATVETGVPAPSDDNNILSKIFKFAIPAGAVLLTFIILLCAGVFKSGDRKALEKYFKASAKPDGKALCEVTVNPYEAEYRYESDYFDYDNKKEMIESFKEEAEDMEGYLDDEFGERRKVKVEIKDVKKYKKKEIKALNEYISDLDNEAYDGDKILQDIRVIKAKVTIKGKDDKESNTGEYVVYKMKGKWYVGGILGLYDKDSIREAINSAND